MKHIPQLEADHRTLHLSTLTCDGDMFYVCVDGGYDQDEEVGKYEQGPDTCIH